ncbi:MAG TPA: 4Fe-4S dicluster domain-containing protein [Gemmatimonadaceae bacterium]
MSTDTGSSGVKRRDFLKIMGTAGATTAAVGCGIDDPGKLIPYLVHPDQTTPGVSTYYATTCRECAAGCGLIAETRDGRTIKLEGNPAHPVNRGALCARGQAALQGLYNPDRYRAPMIREGDAWRETTWDDALAQLTQRLAAVRGAGAANAVFINQHETGSFPAFLDEWLAAYGIGPHLGYEALGQQAVARAHREAYGVAWPRLRFDRARLVVSFGADFLEDWGVSVPQQLDFADARARVENAPRLVYVGPRRSLTGLNADEWIPAKAGSELEIARLLLGETSTAQAAEASGVSEETLVRLQREVQGAGQSMILAGSTAANAYDLALAATRLNRQLGNVGTTIVPGEGFADDDRAASLADMLDLVRRMDAGQVPLAMVRGANPAHSMPRNARFAEAFAKVPVKIGFSSYPDETMALCDIVLPDHHPLESWGAAVPMPGVVSLQQPAMTAVYGEFDPRFAGSRPTADVLLQVAKADAQVGGRWANVADWRALLFSRLPGGEPAITEALTRGFIRGSLPAAARPAPRAAAAAAPPPAIASTAGDFDLVVYPSPVLGDGRGANKPWLQELPDPVTKVVWSSWVEIHPATAERLGIERGDLVRVTTAAGNVVVPALPYLGVRPDTLAIATGQGHAVYGRALYWEERSGDGARIGVNAMDLVPAAADPRSGAILLTVTRAALERTGDDVQIPTTEGSARQHGRGIARAIVASELGTLRTASGAEQATEIAPTGQSGTTGQPTETAAHAPEPDTTFLPGLRSPTANDAEGIFGNDSSKYQGMYAPDHWSRMADRRWAMTIDLARCTGCSACVTACYAENNIPVVGMPYQATAFPQRDGTPGENILRSREMNWIRLERYFEGGWHGGTDPGDVGNFESRFVPMLCQHCGNAPCEPVCPVYATYHSPDGLNVQVYNRCVGTRYCSNNCPYKVRYFNWFGYGEEARPQYAFKYPLNLQLNPDVNVRGKGVMEKCSFCVQRIREAENRATLEGRELEPDEFTTACAAACPSRAIVFGDAADPRWAVSGLVHDPRSYHVFAELNTFTAVVYLQKVIHPGEGQPSSAPAASGAH